MVRYLCAMNRNGRVTTHYYDTKLEAINCLRETVSKWGGSEIRFLSSMAHEGEEVSYYKHPDPDTHLEIELFALDDDFFLDPPEDSEEELTPYGESLEIDRQLERLEYEDEEENIQWEIEMETL